MTQAQGWPELLGNNKHVTIQKLHQYFAKECASAETYRSNFVIFHGDGSKRLALVGVLNFVAAVLARLMVYEMPSANGTGVEKGASILSNRPEHRSMEGSAEVSQNRPSKVGSRCGLSLFVQGT